MRRALAILKYLPAVLCGLLVVAWGLSILRMIMVVGLGDDGQSELVWTAGTFGLVWEPNNSKTFGVEVHRNPGIGSPLGFFALGQDGHYFVIVFASPICFLVTVILPLAVAPFTRFRFPLWSYFAWTALLAAELAYYLG
jgi:hypothetical protein